jgi:putative membrane protein
MSHLTKVFENAGLCLILAVAPALVGAQNSGGQSVPNRAPASTLTAAESKFITEASEGGMAEVELGKLAVLRASDDNVRKFGQRMIDDHGKANDKLRELAISKGVELPNALSAKSRNLKRSLSSLNGVSFDRAYMADMVSDHKEDVAAFQKESNLAHDPQVKSFATQTLPTLREHLKTAQAVAARTSAASSKGNLPLSGIIQNASGKPSPGTPASGKAGSGKQGSLLQ